MGLKLKQYNLYKLFEYQRLLSIFESNKSYYSHDGNWEKYISIIKSIAELDRLDNNVDGHLIGKTFKELKQMFDLEKEVVIEFMRMFYTEFYYEMENLSFDDGLEKVWNIVHQLEAIRND